jgi:hypothetical protein
VFATLQVLIYFLLFSVVLVMCVVALIDALLRPSPAFVAAGKRTKGFWLLVLVAATAVALVAIPRPIGIGQLSFLALASAAAAGVYLVDVRPKVAGHSGGRRSGPSGRRGGW